MISGTERLRLAIDRLEKAARDDCIQADGMLGAWVAAQIDVLNALYVQEEAREEQLRELIEGAKATAEAQAQQMRAEVSKLQQYVAKGELDLAQAQSKSVEAIGDGIAERIQGALVIREKAYNRTKHFSTTLMATAALLGTLLGGYAWSSHDHATSMEAQLRARCRASLVTDKQGRLLCSPSIPVEGE